MKETISFKKLISYKDFKKTFVSENLYTSLILWYLYHFKLKNIKINIAIKGS